MSARAWRWGALAAALAASGALLAACGGTTGGGTTLTLYNGQHVQTTDALVTAFEKATGITVRVRSDDEDVLTNEIVQEGAASPADLVYTENSPALERLQEKGLLAPVTPATLSHVPAAYSSPQGTWVGVSARVSTLVYNTSLLRPDQLPASIMDLANPRWKGKLALAPSETDLQPVVTSVAHAEGDAAALRWLEGIKANAAGHIYPDNETVTHEVNTGQAALGLIDQYYWYREQAQVGKPAMHSALAYFTPRDPGYVLDVSGAAILRSSTHQAAAQKFLAFLVSRQGQEIIAHSDSYEYPIGSGVTTAQPETPFNQLQPNPITVAQLGDGTTAVALLTKAQML